MRSSRGLPGQGVSSHADRATRPRLLNEHGETSPHLLLTLTCLPHPTPCRTPTPRGLPPQDCPAPSVWSPQDQTWPPSDRATGARMYHPHWTVASELGQIGTWLQVGAPLVWLDWIDGLQHWPGVGRKREAKKTGGHRPGPFPVLTPDQ